MAGFDYHDLASAAGADLGFGRWIEIDQPRIDAFAEVTEDRQWIHVDTDRAAAGPFGATIAHGYLTLSLVAPVLEELFTLENAGMSINYGLDRVRFPHPVTVDSRVRGNGEVIEVVDVPGGRQMRIRVTIAAEGTPKPACVADVLVRAYPAGG